MHRTTTCTTTRLMNRFTILLAAITALTLTLALPPNARAHKPTPPQPEQMAASAAALNARAYRALTQHQPIVITPAITSDLELAAARGSSEAQYNLALIATLQNNYPVALAYLEIACNQNFERACDEISANTTNLGSILPDTPAHTLPANATPESLYQKGIQNFDQNSSDPHQPGIYYLEQAALRGHHGAQYTLAIYKALGSQQYLQTIALFNLACEGGYTDTREDISACEFLRETLTELSSPDSPTNSSPTPITESAQNLLQRGIDILKRESATPPENHLEALRAIEQAAALGHPGAQYIAGALKLRQHQYLQAAAYWRLACTQGNAYACEHLQNLTSPQTLIAPPPATPQTTAAH